MWLNFYTACLRGTIWMYNYTKVNDIVNTLLKRRNHRLNYYGDYYIKMLLKLAPSQIKIIQET